MLSNDVCKGINNEVFKEENMFFTVIGVLAVIMVVGHFIAEAGFNIFEGASRLIIGIVGILVLLFAFIGLFS